MNPRRSCRQRSPSPESTQSDLSDSDSSSSDSSDSGSDSSYSGSSDSGSDSSSSGSSDSGSDSVDIGGDSAVGPSLGGPAAAYDPNRLAQTSLARWTREDVPAVRHIDDIVDVETFKNFVVTMEQDTRGEGGNESEDEVELANLASLRHNSFMNLCIDYRVAVQYKKRLPLLPGRPSVQRTRPQ